MTLRVRRVRQDEIEWVNKKYDEVGFPHSSFSDEFIAIAELDNEKAGIGRLIPIDDKNAEMGGMYVFENYRNKGIASKIIEFLLQNSNKFERIYCLPFENLEEYYGKFGFKITPVEDYKNVPKKILEKLEWCNRSFDKKVLLLCLKP